MGWTDFTRRQYARRARRYAMATKGHFVLAHGFDVIRRPAIAGWVGEMVIELARFV